MSKDKQEQLEQVLLEKYITKLKELLEGKLTNEEYSVFNKLISDICLIELSWGVGMLAGNLITRNKASEEDMYEELSKMGPLRVLSTKMLKERLDKITD